MAYIYICSQMHLFKVDSSITSNKCVLLAYAILIIPGGSLCDSSFLEARAAVIQS